MAQVIYGSGWNTGTYTTTASGTFYINTSDSSNNGMGTSKPKPPTDEQWLDEEIEEICALAFAA